MIRSTLFLLLALWGMSLQAQQDSIVPYRNESLRPSVLTNTYLKPFRTVPLKVGKSDIAQQIVYPDGFGRAQQTIGLRSSPLAKDVVEVFDYEQDGVSLRSYLPYVASGTSSGDFRPNALNAQSAFYSAPPAGIGKTGYAYSESVLERSLSRRLLEQGSIDTAWQPVSPSISGSGHTAKMDYGILQPDAGNPGNNMEMAQWDVVGGVLERSPTGYYSKGPLLKTTGKDENWVSGRAGTRETYAGDRGVLMERRYESESSYHSTYYVRDDMDRLRYVIPLDQPLAEYTPNDPAFLKKLYSYNYNGRGQVTEKRMPDRGWEYYVYNGSGQPVLSQDSVQRVKGEWSFVKYDALGRAVISGRYLHPGSRQTLQALVDASADLWEERSATALNGYTDRAFPVGNGAEVYSIDYYDDYDLPASSPWRTPGTGQTKHVEGLPTASYVKILNTNEYLWTVSFYDEKARPVQVNTQNHLGGTDEYRTELNFAGQVLSTSHKQTVGGVATTIAERFVYDHAGRLLEHYHKLGTQAEVLLAGYGYNELGQVTTKGQHSLDGGSHYLQNTDYRYNARGWLTHINDGVPNAAAGKSLGMELKFNHAADPQYNGNIGGMSWKSARSTKPAMEYRFGYDKLDRLRSSKSSGGGIAAGSYNEYVDYGDRGKIESLGRYALVSGVRQQIDSLKYTYDHDRHIKIDDISTAAAGIKALGFNEKVQQAVEYVYDGNGRVVSDANLGIERISYNALGLIDTIRWSGTSGQQTVYLYDALGSKLQSSYVQDGITLTTDYVGGIQYRKEGTGARTLDFVHTAEGRARKSGTTFRYEYDQRDHLGNVRLSVDANPSDPLQRTARIIQENGYYPFGLVMSGPELNFALGDKNEYLYNGKELQRGTGWYDYGARQYDASIGRWHAPDPLAEKHYDLNAYHYVMNNPMLYMDYMGLTDTVSLDDVSRIKVGDMIKWRDGTYELFTEELFSAMMMLEAPVTRTVQSKKDMLYTGSSSKNGLWMANNTVSAVMLLNLRSFSGSASISPEQLKAQQELGMKAFLLHEARVKNIQDNYGKDAGGRNGFDTGNDIVGGLGLATDLGAYSWNNASNKQQWRSSYKTHQYLKGKGYNIKTSTIKNTIPKAFKATGTGLGIVSGVITVGDALYNSEINASHILDATITGVSFIPGIGWVIGGGYFVGDMIHRGVYGYSIGDRLDSAVGGSVYNWDW